MKVLLVSQYFWPETFGINALSQSIQGKGVELTVLTGKPNYPDGAVFDGYSAKGCVREIFHGIEVIRMPLFPRGYRSPFRLLLNYFSFIASGTIFGPWLLRGRRFDAIFVYAPSPVLQALPAIWLSRLKKAPLILWVQDLWPESLAATGFIKNRLILNLVTRTVRFIYRHTDSILIPSKAFYAPIAKLVENGNRIHYYPNPWIEEAGKAGEESDAINSLVTDIASSFSVVFAGNLGTAQSLETIINAAERLQRDNINVRFFLIGSGSMSAWLENEISRRNLKNVLLPGRFPPTAMRHFYKAASALLVSLRDEPIFAYTIPSKVQGYLAAGRPIIAALNGEGARLIEEARAGIACPAGNSVTLATAVEQLFQLAEDKRAEMGENARLYASKHFALDQLSNDLAKHLCQISASYQKATLEENS